MFLTGGYHIKKTTESYKKFCGFKIITDILIKSNLKYLFY